MSHSEPTQRLLEILFAAQRDDAGEGTEQFASNVADRVLGAVDAQLIEAIANEREQIAQLNALSGALTGESSLLKEEAGEMLTCDECRERLNAFVEDQVAGADVARAHPTMHAHLQGCVDCAADAALLAEVLQTHTEIDAPSYASFESWFQQKQAGAQESPPAGALEQLWRRTDEHVHQLLDEIAVAIRGGSAAFGELPGGLQPRTVPGLAFRNRDDDTVELVELPHPEANTVVRVRTGPVIDDEVALIVEVGALDPPQPIAGARITLRDSHGNLLEGTASNEQGVAAFDRLEVDKYLFRIEHKGQTWIFSVNLQAP